MTFNLINGSSIVKNILAVDQNSTVPIDQTLIDSSLNTHVPTPASDGSTYQFMVGGITSDPANDNKNIYPGNSLIVGDLVIDPSNRRDSTGGRVTSDITVVTGNINLSGAKPTGVNDSDTGNIILEKDNAKITVGSTKQIKIDGNTGNVDLSNYNSSVTPDDYVGSGLTTTSAAPRGYVDSVIQNNVIGNAPCNLNTLEKIAACIPSMDVSDKYDKSGGEISGSVIMNDSLHIKGDLVFNPADSNAKTWIGLSGSNGIPVNNQMDNDKSNAVVSGQIRVVTDEDGNANLVLGRTWRFNMSENENNTISTLKVQHSLDGGNSWVDISVFNHIS